METLHLLSHSPFNDSRINSCLQLLGTGDGLLLSGDAVYVLQPGNVALPELLKQPDEVAIFALQEDLLARGMTSIPARVNAIDYATFVDLCISYSRVNSWL